MASQYEQSSGPDLHAAVESLPSYQLVDKDGRIQPVSDSRIVAIHNEDSRLAAMIVSEELLNKIKTSLDDGIRAIVQEETAKAKNPVLRTFEEWVQKEQEELSAQMKVVEAVPGSYSLLMSLDLQSSMLNDKLDLVAERRAALKEEMKEAEKVAELSQLGTYARLYDLFKAHGFTDHDDSESHSLDDGFLREWAVPEQGEMAQRDFNARAGDVQEAQCDFDWYWGRIKQAKNESASEAGRREFKANNRLTRKLTEAWERFRAARRHCHDLGVRVPNDSQSSSLAADSEDGEEQFHVFMKPFCGPEKHPWVAEWLDDVEDGRGSTAVHTRRERIAAPRPEMDEWDAGSDLCPWESQSETAEGREKDRIRIAEAVRDSLRDDPIEQRQKVMTRKRKRDADQNEEDEVEIAKTQKKP
ncbi:hypothetical protein M409DRAFT_61477 [Zasmidium cellare ATCC 36951]|uniref:Uncharacterized protein n=1 Tax=Zasmidium cellare ATCC 36951 TaxID=1080233 RepID=A0A6A6BV19_ZASCE|nr:uncharacterized protein M409DRAFT_61477 [Zasmidium cellare ATCC 36951]KAF2158637.1 hypothetical protein M409DRAFT_61477 [Zasmidium cellare ATCC 36951]